MINKGKLCSYQNARFSKQTSQLKTKKLMMYSPGDPFIMVAPVVTSWAVAGQRMVFLHMYSSGTSHAGGVPRSDP